MSDYNPPEDNGKFFSQHHFHDQAYACHDGITTFDSPKQNPLLPFRYFVKVGGGYQAFLKLSNARKFYRAD